MDIPRNHFYVTLFSNASKEVFPDNTLTAFTIHLAQPIDLGSSDWEVGLAELSYKAPKRQIIKGTAIDVITSVNVLVYYDLITPQIVGTENVRLLRTIICSTQLGNHMFQNVYYLRIEKKLFQDIRIKLRETNYERAAFEASIIPTKLVLHFRRVYINLTSVRSCHLPLMHPLTRYYIHQTGGGGGGGGGGIGPIYTLPPFVQRGHGIGDYLGPLFRAIKPWFFRVAKAGAKALGRAALQTGSHILSDIDDNPEGYKDISKHIRETLPAKMAGGGRRKRGRPPSRARRPSAKRRKRAPSTSRKPRGKNLREKVVAVLNVGLLGPL